MEAALKALIAVLILSFLAKGMCDCSYKDIVVSQAETGALVEGKKEYEVTMSNNCICTQLDVKVNCLAFSTVEEVDPAILQKDGDAQSCLVNKDQPFHGFTQIKFKYAWDNEFPLTPTSSTIACS